MPIRLEAHVGKVEDGCPEILDTSADFSLFSPPYFKRDGYTPELMLSVGKVLGRVLKPGARAYMVFGQIKEGLDRPLEAQRLVLAGAGGALAAGQTIIWVKSIAIGGWSEDVTCPKCAHGFKHKVPVLSRGHFQPINSPDLLNYCWEYVFCFVKQPKTALRPMDRLSIGVPFTHKGNLTRGTRGKNGDVHCIGDVWYIPYETTGATAKKTHRHEFPEELAEKAISVAGIPAGSMVYDVFLGGGTTARVAQRNRMSACGYDMNPAHIETVKAMWSAPAPAAAP